VAVANIVCAAVLMLAGCGAPELVVPTSEEPFLHLVLAPDLRFGGASEAPREQYAVLLTTGSPLAADCLAAERFEMRRTRDGAPFAWRFYGNCLQVRAGQGVGAWENANYYLPETAPGDSLGAADLEPGEWYELEIETRGRLIRGSTIIPAEFALSILQRDGRRYLSWPRVDGAAGYKVTIIDQDGSKDWVQTDTIHALPAGAAQAFVTAFDANLFEYARDEQSGRAGLDAGFGVFGAMKTAEISF
jgi:hypothetical protein